MSLTNTNREARRTKRPVAVRDLRFAGTVAAGLVAGVLGVGALSAPLLGWSEWPDTLQRGGGEAPVPPEVVGRAFAAKEGEIFTAPSAQLTVVIGRVNDIKSRPLAELAGGVHAKLPAITLDLIQEIGEGARQYARRTLKVKTNPERALSAIGIDPKQAAAPNGGGSAR